MNKDNPRADDFRFGNSTQANSDLNGDRGSSGVQRNASGMEGDRWRQGEYQGSRPPVHDKLHASQSPHIGHDSQVVTPPDYPSSAPQQSGRGRRLLVFVIVIGALLLTVGGAGAFLYWQRLNNSPEKVLADALINTSADIFDRQPISAFSAITVESKEGDWKIRIDLNSKQVEADREVAADIAIDYKDYEFTMSATAVMIGSEEWYFKIDDLRKTIYLALDAYFGEEAIEVSEDDVEIILEQLDPFIRRIDGQWVRVTREDVGSWAGDEETVDQCGEAVEELRISRDDQSNLKGIFSEHQFIVATEVYDMQAIDGEKSFHYKIDFRDEQTEHFAKKAIKLDSFKSVVEACGVDEGTFDSRDSMLRKDKEGAKKSIELWVSAKTRRATKARLSLHDTTYTMDLSTKIKINPEGLVVKKPGDFMTLEEMEDELDALSDILENSISEIGDDYDHRLD